MMPVNHLRRKENSLKIEKIDRTWTNPSSIHIGHGLILVQKNRKTTFFLCLLYQSYLIKCWEGNVLMGNFSRLWLSTQMEPEPIFDVKFGNKNSQTLGTQWPLRLSSYKAVFPLSVKVGTIVCKVLMGGHHLPYPLPGFLTTTLSTQSMKALPAKGLQSFFKSVVEDVTESEYAPIEGNSCAAHIVRDMFLVRGCSFLLDTLGPTLRVPMCKPTAAAGSPLKARECACAVLPILLQPPQRTRPGQRQGSQTPAAGWAEEAGFWSRGGRSRANEVRLMSWEPACLESPESHLEYFSSLLFLGGGVLLCVIEWWNWWFIAAFCYNGFCSDSPG